MQKPKKLRCNDLESYIPLFIIAAVLIIAALLKNWIHKHNLNLSHSPNNRQSFYFSAAKIRKKSELTKHQPTFLI